MLAKAITAVMIPVRAALAGSPILARRLLAPTAKRRAAEAELRKKAAALRSEGRAAELAKLTGDALVKAQQAHAAEDRAEREARRSKAADVAGAALLAALVGGPVAWSAVGPWAPAAVWGGIGLWCIAAIMHAPARPAAEEEEDETEAAEQEPAEVDEEPSPEALRAAVLARLLGWVGDRNGIPIAEVYERYRKEPGHEHLTDAQIRTALVGHYGLTVKPVRVDGRTPQGIHRDDLQPLPSPAVAETVADERNTPLTSTVAA